MIRAAPGHSSRKGASMSLHWPPGNGHGEPLRPSRFVVREPMSTLIVGDPADPHIRAVAELLPPDNPVIVEVRRLAALLYTFEAAHAVRPGVDPAPHDPA